ncbi:MAG: glutaredoxin family protein [Planctomycetaceae bacterium]
MSNPPDPFQRTVNARIGTALLTLAGALSVLIFLDRATSIAVPFPGIWYRSRGLHLVLCIGLYVLAWLTLRNASDPPDDEHAGTVPLSFRSVRMFTKHHCELCDRRQKCSRRFRDQLPDVEVIDIEGDAELQRRFGEWVPVVEIDGEVRFRGSVNAALLERMIEAKQNQLRRMAADRETA